MVSVNISLTITLTLVLCTLFCSVLVTLYTNMGGKRAENVIEIRAYIKARSLLGLKPVDIHREVCDI